VTALGNVIHTVDDQSIPFPIVLDVGNGAIY
jgi:hypothetical protein